MNSERGSVVLEIRGLRKRYGRSEVLSGVDLDIAAGGATGLVGVNGAGKTTLLRCALDFTEPDAGEVRIHGRPHRLPEARAGVAYLPERFSPPYFLTGREFLRFMHRIHGQPFQEEVVKGILVDIDLSPEALDRPVRSLSKGMTQKLGLSACFLSGRSLLVLDEPMSGLDPKARALVKRVLLGMRARGITLLITSHSLPDVEEICDHMVVLHRGVVNWQGTPGDLRDQHGGRPLEQAFLESIEAQ